MKREVRNYIFMGLGCIIILILITSHLLFTVNDILIAYNIRTREINDYYVKNWTEMTICFFGYGFKDISFLYDLILTCVIILIILMVFLKVYWSVKEK